MYYVYNVRFRLADILDLVQLQLLVEGRKNMRGLTVEFFVKNVVLRTCVISTVVSLVIVIVRLYFSDI